MIADLISIQIAVATSFQITVWSIHAICSCLGPLGQTSLLATSAMAANRSAPKKTSGVVITAQKKEFNKITSICISSSQCEAKTGKAKNHLCRRPVRLIPPTLTCARVPLHQVLILSMNKKARWICRAARCADSACADLRRILTRPNSLILRLLCAKGQQYGCCALLLLTQPPSSFDDA